MYSFNYAELVAYCDCMYRNKIDKADINIFDGIIVNLVLYTKTGKRMVVVDSELNDNLELKVDPNIKGPYTIKVYSITLLSLPPWEKTYMTGKIWI